jgi:hypothetical protein
MPGSKKNKGGKSSWSCTPVSDNRISPMGIDLSDDIVFDQFDQFTTNQGNYGASIKDQNQVISPLLEAFSGQAGTNNFFGF